MDSEDSNSRLQSEIYGGSDVSPSAINGINVRKQ